MNQKTKKILLCTVPNISLFSKKFYMEIGIGASYLSGGLDSFGYKVDYHDFNVALNSVRKKNDSLANNDKLVLSEIKYLLRYLERPNKKSVLYIWSDKLVKQIKGDGYDYIGLSLDRKIIKKDISFFSLHFGIILASLLYRKFRVPIYVGGKHNLLLVGRNYIDNLISGLKKIPVAGFFLGEGTINFPEFLNKIRKDSDLTSSDLIKREVIMVGERRKDIGKIDKLLVSQDNDYFKKRELDRKKRDRNNLGINVIPRFDIKNRKFLFFNPLKLFPLSLIKPYPNLNKIKPFYILPFTFMRGCVNRCAFCSRGCNKNFYAIPVKEVVDKIERLLERHNSCYFRFYNSQINFSQKYVLDFCNEIIKRKVKIKFSDSANLRHASKEIFHALKEAGCLKLWYSAETASSQLLKKIKKDLKLKKIQSGLLESANAGIWNAVNLIINFPHESEADFELDRRFIRENKDLIDCLACNTFQLHKGTYMAIHSAEYGIKIIKLLDNIRGYSFDEINGLSWQEKVILGKTRIDQIYEDVDYLKNLVLSNDYLLFSFSQITDKKDELKEIMKNYIEILKKKNHNSYRDFVLRLDPIKIEM